MFGLGMGELLVILAVALLVLGPKRLPDVASGLGKAIREFRKATRDLQNQIDLDESVAKPLQELKAALRDEPVTALPSAAAKTAPAPNTVPASPTEPAATAAVAAPAAPAKSTPVEPAQSGKA
jgi:TatA/E family protein of Tat protein translocase